MYIAYIYDIHGSLITQIFDISKVRINERINDISFCEFSVIDPTLAKRSIFQEFNRVVIAMQDPESTQEITLFRWVVRGIKPRLSETQIILNSEEYILQKWKLFRMDKVYNIGTSLSSIMWELRDHINTRFPGLITLDIQTSATLTESVDIKANTSAWDFVRRVWGEIFEYRYGDGVLFFWDTYGKDRSTWQDFLSFEWDIESPDSRNISDASWEYDAESIVNVYYSPSGTLADTESIGKYGRIEEYVREGNTSVMLEENSESRRSIDIDPIVKDYHLGDLGDMVQVYINSWNELLDYSWVMKITEKSFSSWDLIQVNYKVSTSKFKTLDAIDTIRNLKKRVRNLEL